MTDKADFNAEEWSLLRQAPPLAGLRVVMADRGGMVSESLSMARAYTEVRDAQWGGDGARGLVEELALEGPELDRARFGSLSEDARVDEVQRAAVDTVRDAVALLGRKATPEEAEDYRRFVLALAQRVAEAHKEGGFLGIGGTRVSEAEQAALDEIERALSDPAP